ncbi:hypothetical protein [Microcoleus sp. FACHB-831]|nr:hypothetical protein [Microcoleus sp. FACHB-831]
MATIRDRTQHARILDKLKGRRIMEIFHCFNQTQAYALLPT